MEQKEQKTKLCLLRDIFRSIREYEMEFQQRYGLCLNEGMTLCSLNKKGKTTSSDLADCLGLSTSNMSKVLKSVEEKGLVERILGDTDKRNMYFKLSEEGVKKLKKINLEEDQIDSILNSIYKMEGIDTISIL